MQHRESSLRDVQLQSDARYFLYDSNRAGSLPGVCKSVLRLYIPRVWLEAGVELSLHMKESPSTATEPPQGIAGRNGSGMRRLPMISAAADTTLEIRRGRWEGGSNRK